MEKGKKSSCLVLILFVLFLGIRILQDHQTKVPIIGSDVEVLKQEFPLVGKYKDLYKDREDEIWICLPQAQNLRTVSAVGVLHVKDCLLPQEY